MKTKSKLAEKIQMLQASAAAICHACPLRMTAECRGPSCADIIHVVNEIDPLVSEYFRLELAEKRTLRLRKDHQRVRQLCLPINPACELLAGAGECAACDNQLYAPSQDDDTEDDTVREIPPQYGLGYGLTQYALLWESLSEAHPGSSAQFGVEPGQNGGSTGGKIASFPVKPAPDAVRSGSQRVKILVAGSGD